MSIALIQNSNELVVYTAGDGSQFNGLDMLLNAWLHGKSNNTKETYRRITRLFLESSQCDISKTGLIHLHQFIDTLQGKSANTIKTYTMVIKSLLSFCKKLGIMQFNPGALVKPPKPETARHEKVVGQVEVQLLFKYENNLRNKLILQVMYYSGMRVSELISRRWCDVTELEDGSCSIYVFGKGRKERYVKVPAHVYKELKAIRIDNYAPLFVSRKGELAPLSRQQVGKIVKDAAKNIEREKASPHWLRHSHATHGYENGASLAVIRDTLGHESISTTSLYIRSNPNQSSTDYLK